LTIERTCEATVYDAQMIERGGSEGQTTDGQAEFEEIVDNAKDVTEVVEVFIEVTEVDVRSELDIVEEFRSRSSILEDSKISLLLIECNDDDDDDDV